MLIMLTTLSGGGPRCFVCRRAFDFEAGESARIVRHVAYAFDLVHEGRCLAAARALIFAEPGYDIAAFGVDQERSRVLWVDDADGWVALLAGPAGRSGGWRRPVEPPSRAGPPRCYPGPRWHWSTSAATPARTATATARV